MINAGLISEFESVLTGRWLTDFSNASAFLFENLQPINWAGFYLLSARAGTDQVDQKLYLGPFQGRVACTEIDFHRGVCGAAFLQRQTLIVPDVHQFPGHIACDPRSRSEIVVPLIFEDHIYGVLDVDSDQLDRFHDADELFLNAFVKLLLARQNSRPPGLALR